MTETFAIAPYPLSGAYVARLEELAGGHVDVLDLPKLRRLGTRGLMQELWSHRGRPCLLALEDPSSAALLPALEILGTLSGASRVSVVDHDLASTPVSRWRALPDGAGLLLASARLRVEQRGARRELDQLLAAERLSPIPARRSAALYLNGNLWFGVKAGGSVGHIAGVANALSERGVHVDLAAVDRPVVLRPDVGFVQLPLPASFGVPTELNQYAFSRACARFAADRLGQGRYGVLYQRLSAGSYAGAMASRATRVPLIVEYNGSETWAARHWGRQLADEDLAIAAEQALLRHAHLCVTVSTVLGDELVARGVEPDRIVVYPNGVDPQRFDPHALAGDRDRLRRRLGFAPDHVVATFVGTFGSWHGVDVLAQTIERFVAEEGGRVARGRLRFMLVGDGVRMDDVQRILGASGRSITTLTGLVPQEQAPAYLAASDILLSPHVRNGDGTPFFGSPTKLYEYMAIGAAIIASDLDQLGETLRPALAASALPAGEPGNGGELAVLTRPGDAEGLLLGIRFLAERPDWRARLGANARQRALERHTWGHHVDAILDGLHAVVPSALGASTG